MKAIMSNMLWVPRDHLNDEATLKKDLIVHPRAGLEGVQPIKSYKETDSYLGIPRNYPFQIEAEDQRIKGEPQNFPFHGELRKFQAELIDRWRQSFNEGYSDWIISADTGAGKSPCALKIAAEIGSPFLVIVPLERLMGQWIEHINRFLGVPNGRIGRVQGDTCDYNNPVCVGMIHSICKDKYPEAFKNKFGLIIYDECHKVSADTFSEVAGMFPAHYRLGLSVHPESFCEFFGGPFEDGWVGSIEEAFFLMSNYSDVITNNYGQLVLDSSNFNIYTRGFQNNGFCWKKVNCFIRHKNTKRMYNVRVRGRNLSVTEDHSIYRLKNSGFYVWKKGSKKQEAVLESITSSYVESGNVLPLDNGKNWGHVDNNEELLDVCRVVYNGLYKKKKSCQSFSSFD